MSYETIELERIERSCPACEDYARKHSVSPPKIAILACEGSCAKGEVARQAANLVAHRLASDSTVRICLGGAFTKDTGQRDLVRRTDKVIAIEGCFIDCASRMMKGVIPDLQPTVVRADRLYDAKLPFGVDEVPHEMLVIYASEVAKKVIHEHVNRSSSSPCACGTAGARTTKPARAADGGVQSTSCCGSTGGSCSQPAEGHGSSACGAPQHVLKATWDGQTSFTSRNADGLEVTMGHSGKTITAVEGLMAALGSCAGMSTIGKLKERGLTPEAVDARVEGQRRATAPTSFESLHVILTLRGDLKDEVVAKCVDEAMTLVCPIATTLNRAVKLTWEYRLSR
ncbi:putative zinc-binding protein [Methanocella sp. MCL-LM]|uniref:putative zinc-binding protein n=1 Tax=Methanocella sp. MCL-LM TaxID=3412035 RepID=UPI003C724EE3